MILALESSCDETAAAIFDPAVGLTGEWVYTQIALHEQHGGVVPELAAREHLRNFPLVLEEMAGTVKAARPPLGSVAVTCGPGLAPCLALGVAAAKALGLALNLPVVGVNHLRGHVWSPYIALHAAAPDVFEARAAALFPHLALLVSGGHTLLVHVEADRSLRVISSTRDDAAGEALDKGAKLLGLGYPGGPLIEAAAERGRIDAFDFPRGLNRHDELDFSFSGLKTALRYTLEKMTTEEVVARRDDLCASYQQAIIDALGAKTEAALRAGRYRSLGLSGGVARNQALRRRLSDVARRAGAEILPVLPAHAGDNAAMIAFAAWFDPGGTTATGLDLGIMPSLGL